jgi:UDP-N-acetylglucosamine--N-acetylmuramyl-(pentapeptide) pyrophosphoryl-undecaprenol N-acetylglucosamine transferase
MTDATLRADMAKHSKQLGVPDAADEFINLIENVLQ